MQNPQSIASGFPIDSAGTLQPFHPSHQQMTRRRDIPGTWGDRILKNLYNLNSFCLDWIEFAGRFDMPVLKPCPIVPDNLFPFDERNKYRPGDGAIQFYAEDSEMESVWLRANRYPHVPAVVQKAGIALTPDFSVYSDYPIATQIWNVYRSRLLGAIWAYQGIQVIPSVVWGLPSTFDWCFDGLPVGGSLAVSTGHIRGQEEQIYFLKGFREMVQRCQPDTVLVYGRGMQRELSYFHPNIKRYDSRLTQIYYARKEHNARMAEQQKMAVG